MAQACYWLVLILACLSLVRARSSICLSTGSTVYKPVQLYPKDCPNNQTYCMSDLYKYDPTLFKSKSVPTLLPKSRETLVYLTQDENDNLDGVVITATTYKKNIIKMRVKADGSTPASILTKDDPTEDTWAWDATTNTGEFSWLLEPTFTDGAVFGHFNIVDNFCLSVSLMPNWAGAIATMSSLTGTVAQTTRVGSKPVSTTQGAYTEFHFCLYPQVMFTSTNEDCGQLGSASAISVNKTASAFYLWTKAGQTIGTSSTITGLTAGVYTVRVTVDGCEAKRDITIKSNQNCGCDAGSAIVGDVCTICPAGTFSEERNSASCKVCPPGSWNNVAGSTSCSKCPKNTVSHGGNNRCTVCPENTFSAIGEAICKPCAVGTSRALNAETCTACSAGSVRCSSDGSCSQCSPGTFAVNSNSACEWCAPGTYAEGSGNTACVTCPINTYASAGASSCTPCAVGKTSPAGSSVTLSCM